MTQDPTDKARELATDLGLAHNQSFKQAIVKIASALQGERSEAALDIRAADRLAVEVARLIERKIIGGRSPAADALLDYKSGEFFGPTDRAAIQGSEPQAEPVDWALEKAVPAKDYEPPQAERPAPMGGEAKTSGLCPTCGARMIPSNCTEMVCRSCGYIGAPVASSASAG